MDDETGFTPMPEIKRLNKRLDLSSLSSDWRLTPVSIDWQGEPLVLFQEGKPPRPRTQILLSGNWLIRTEDFSLSSREDLRKPPAQVGTYRFDVLLVTVASMCTTRLSCANCRDGSLLAYVVVVGLVPLVEEFSSPQSLNKPAPCVGQKHRHTPLGPDHGHGQENRRHRSGIVAVPFPPHHYWQRGRSLVPTR